MKQYSLSAFTILGQIPWLRDSKDRRRNATGWFEVTDEHWL